MFGQTGNTSFGGFNAPTQSSLFGQSAFGKPIATTSFGTGTAPVFGSSNTSLFGSKPAGSTTGGLFGNATATPAFGQPVTTQSSFGGFGSTNTNANLFGSPQNANTSLFGASSATPAFGQPNKPGGFGFGTSTGTSLFGQPQQPTQQATPSVFGQPSTTGNTSLFGTAGGFGSTNTTAGMSGTIVKFNPVTGSDTMAKNGVTQNISTRHQCITFMKEYESKSLEELRLEDYTAGRKGTGQAGQTGGLFGATPQASPFGSTGAGTNTATTGFGSMTGGFGSTSQPGSTSLFGKPMTSFGGTATTTSAFAFNPTTTSNLFGTNAQAKPFGAAAPSTLFASTNPGQTAGTAFGTINGTPSTSFGTFGSTQPNQSIGLFNQNKSTFNMPASTASAGFGGFGQTAPTNASTGLFGAKPAGTAGFGTASTFGSTAAPTFGTGAGFGTTPSTNTSLFNSPFKPTGQTTGFSFGSTPVSSTGLGTNTGLNLGGGSSLFGQPKPSGLFGNTGTGTTFNSTGMFGSTTGFGTNTNVTPGLGLGMLGGGIGTNQTQPTSGSVPVHQQILALVSAPFGDSPLLKNLLPASGKMEEFLKPSNPTSRTLNSPQYKVATNNNSPKVKARAVTVAQLSKKSLFEGLEEEDPTLLEAFQPRANAKRLVLRPKSIMSPTIQSSNDSLNSPRNDNNRDDNTDSSVQPEKHVEFTNKETNQENNRQPVNDRRTSSSWLKSTLPRKTKMPDDEFEGQRSPFRGIDVSEEALDNTVDELRPQGGTQGQAQLLSATFNNSASNCSINVDKSAMDSTGHSTDSSHELDDTPLSTFQTDYEPNAAKVILCRSGYYTIPPLDKLQDYVSDETCIVPNFTVGRKGYGNVYFPDSFDVYGLNLDEIVHFRHKEVIIYPDDEKKPPVGQGLNRRAQVTLDRVWPHDKTVHEPITDPCRLTAMHYEGKLRRVSAKHDTRFLEYRPETGSWVFKVDHFSKYGLSDSDDEDSDIPLNSEVKKLKGVGAIPRKFPGVSEQLQMVKTLKKVYQDTTNLNGLPNETKSIAENLRSDFFEEADITSDNSSSNDYMGERQIVLSPTEVYARLVGTDSHKLQLMKASFFDTNDKDINDSAYKDPQQLYLKNQILESFEPMEEDQIVPMGHVPVLRSNLMAYQEPFLSRKESMSSIEEIQSNEKTEISTTKSSSLIRAFPSPVVTPTTVVLKFPSEVIPLKESIISKLNFRCIADTGIQMGRTFRAGWGPGLTLVSLSTQKQAAIVPLQGSFSQLGSYVSGRLLGDTTSSIVQRLQILGGCGTDSDYIQTFKENIERHLRIQLNHCIMGQEGDCPAIGTGADIAALHAHCTLAQELADQLVESDRLLLYASEVWNLCVALWGNLPDIQPSIDKTKHHNVMVRREAFSEWLESVVAETVQREITDTSSHDQTMLSLLTAHKLEEASKLARKVGDHSLALLMAQLGGASSVKELTKQQLALWQETEVDGDLSMDRLKLFMMVAGEPLISSKQGTINICEGLDWKRALALHLWYICTPTASITDALDLYEAAFDTDDTEIYASKPHPEYKEDYEAEVSSGKSIYDLCFHLMKLYCTGNHSLEELLNPLTHTADPLDYRLSWLVQQVLVALGYSHLSAHAATLTHINFAAQLETFDLWHWAIFVVLHIQDTARRRIAVIDLLSRHVELDEDSEYIRREEFLKEELGIPSMWINQAKAVKGRATKRYGEAAWYLIQAEQWNMAHELIIEHLAADAIINENYEYMRSLLSSLVPPECNSTISGWAHQGQLLWDYMVITAEVEALLQSTDCSKIGYKLELLQPQLTLLCSKINQFPCPTAKHRLCQAEIAKRTSHLARSLLLLQSKDNRSTAKVLAYLVSQLPLPEDYAQQELRPIVDMCVNEVITH